MKGILMVLLMMLLTVSVMAQEPILILTPEDIQYQFWGEGWKAPTNFVVAYSAEPIGVHKYIGKAGKQTWEVELSPSRKAIMEFDIILPNKNRTYQLQVRMRTETEIGPWSEMSETVYVVGKPVNIWK